MQFLRTSAVVASLVSLAVPALAQESGLSTGTPVTEGGDEVGQAYVAESFGDWEKRCVRAAEGEDPCQLYQLIRDSQGGSVAEMTVFALPEGQDALAGATIITPLETLLTQQVTLSVDGGGAKRYPFSFCTPAGCIARVGLLEEDLAAFRAGNTARIRIVPAVAPDQEVLLNVSLSGFTAGYNAISQ